MTRRVFRYAALGLLLGACASQELQDYSNQWDKWLGSTKDERIRELGIPTRCHKFQDGGEVCEWSVPTQDGRNETIGLTFDTTGKTCQWSYRGFYGQKKSTATCIS
jgi:hypothetical protein